MSWLGPILFAAFVWWFSTGLIFFLDRLPRRSTPWSVGVATVMAIAAFVALAWLRDMTTLAAAYGGFLCAIILWGWVEMTFLAGLVTGPRRSGCPPGVVGRVRFFYAMATVAHHELALVAIGIGLGILHLGAENGVALWTFLVLWSMRISAKINIFLGVPNFSTELLPERMRYLASYFRVAPMNWFFPISLTLASVACGAIICAAAFYGVDTVAGIGLLLAGTLLALAIFEHWAMILPIEDAALWRWIGQDRDEEPTKDDTHMPRAATLSSPSGVSVRLNFANFLE